MRLIVSLVLMGLVGSAGAAAQQVDGGGVPYRTWDVNTSVGLHLTDPHDAGAPDRDNFGTDMDASAAYGIEVGRYWTSHLKTEAGVQLRPDWTAYGDQRVTLPNGQTGSVWRRSEISLAQVSLGATWQFLENTFAHPYVAAGARIGVASTTTISEDRAWVYDGRQSIYYPVERNEAQTTTVLVRPFLSGGFKSYFTERVFARPEVSSAWTTDGASQLTFRLGFGIDF